MTCGMFNWHHDAKCRLLWPRTFIQAYRLALSVDMRMCWLACTLQKGPCQSSQLLLVCVAQ